MPEKVTISHRGARYEIGRGKRFYGIWVAGAPESDPVDRWPETREGWEQAWTRFVAIETPDTIRAVEQQRAGFTMPGIRLKHGIRPTDGPAVTATITDAAAGRRRGPARELAGAALLWLGVLLGVIGLFPGYVGPSLAAQAHLLVPHLLYLVTWAVSGALVVGGLRSRPGAARFDMTRIGALLGIGLSAVTFGLFFADLGQVISGGASLLGAGLVLSLLGWLACAAGSVLALGPVGRPGKAGGTGAVPGGPGRPRRTDAGPVTLLLLAAAGTVAAFAPSWDSYTVTQAATGASETVTAGNVFAFPGPVIAGNVAVMVAIVAVAALAALWRPARHGAVLLAGAIVALAAQAISALIQVSEPVTPAMFGVSRAQAASAGLTFASGVTPIFWVYCVFVISLLISCAWMLTAPHYQALQPAPPPPGPGPVYPPQSSPGEAGDSGAEARDSGAGEAGDSDDGTEGHQESTYA